MVNTETNGIVIKIIPFEDRHQIIHFLSAEMGLLSLLAKNSVGSKRYGNTLDLFNVSRLSFTDKEHASLGFLKEAHLQKSFSAFQTSFQKLSCSSLLAEIISRVAQPREPSTSLFQLLFHSLSAIEETEGKNFSALALLTLFEFKLLQATGHALTLDKCLNCGDSVEEMAEATGVLPEHIFGVPRDAGWSCGVCAPKFKGITVPLLLNHLRILSVLSKTPIRAIYREIPKDKEFIEPLFEFIHQCMLYHLPGLDAANLKSLRFVRETETRL